MPSVIIDRNHCKGCELCISPCPQNVLRMSKTIGEKGYFYAELFDPSRCIGCCICAIICPDIAIKVKTNGTVFTLFEY